MTNEKNIAYEEFISLLNDDCDFANNYKNTKKDFQEWYQDVYLITRGDKNGRIF